MLYLDSSALIKRYVQEVGTAKIDKMLQSDVAAAFTSALTFAEVHATLGRRAKDKSLSLSQFSSARNKFDSDWTAAFNVVDLQPSVLAIVRNLVDQFTLRGADLVHLASSIWLRDTHFAGAIKAELVFVTSDKQLANAAATSGLSVFNPETAP